MKSIVIAMTCLTAIAAADNMKAFPPAEKGMTRHVLVLPKLEDESASKVELIVGKMMEVDSVNRHMLGGNIEKVTIEGWGFDRYVVKKTGPVAQTLMAPAPGAPMVRKFVTLGGEPFIVRYNSQLPIVVYVPEGVEVRHRIWIAGPESSAIPEG